MDYINRLSNAEKRNAIMSAVVIGGLLLWSSSMQSSLPVLMGLKDAVPRTEAQKSGFPSQEKLPDYQTAIQSNAGMTPSYSSVSAFGK